MIKVYIAKADRVDVQVSSICGSVFLGHNLADPARFNAPPVL